MHNQSSLSQFLGLYDYMHEQFLLLNFYSDRGAKLTDGLTAKANACQCEKRPGEISLVYG